MADVRLVFSGAPVPTPGPVRLVFGVRETPVAQGVRLVFRQAPVPTPGAVRLVFGESDQPAPSIPDATLSGAAQVTGLRLRIGIRTGAQVQSAAQVTGLRLRVSLQSAAVASIAARVTGLRLRIAAVYDVNVQRPVAGETTAQWQGGASVLAGVSLGHEGAEPVLVVAGAAWQQAVRLSDAWGARHGDSDRSARPLIAALWQGAQAVPTAVRQHHWQEAEHLRAHGATGFQQGASVRSLANTMQYQDAQRLRNWAAARHEQAVAHSGLVHTGRVRDAAPAYYPWDSRYQEAMRPPPGLWAPNPVVPGEPCYVPNTRLVFAEGPGGTRLVFVCEKHSPPPEPGKPVIVPVRSLYVVFNETSLRRVDGNIQLPTFGMSMSLDVDSFTWSMQAALPTSEMPHLEPSLAGDPVEVEAIINGAPYRFLVESLRRERQFGQDQVSISGRGLTALLDSPYAAEMFFGNTVQRTARQLMDDVLTLNGVSLGWTVDWGLTDWNVPGNVWKHSGSYISALNNIASSVGGYVQPLGVTRGIRVLSRYPQAPWAWDQVTPDFVLPADVVLRESVEWLDKPVYNRVHVSGVGAGVLGVITRGGTDGVPVAPMLVDALITEGPAALQRGRVALSNTGRQAQVGLRMPVLPETGIITPGAFIDYVAEGTTRRGLVRSVQVEVGFPDVWQSLGVETHVP